MAQPTLTIRSAPSARDNVRNEKELMAPREEHVVVVSSLEHLPLMLTVGEVAQILRISRTSAYKLTEQWRASGGRSGLPVVKLGSRLLVRRVDLAVIVGVGPPIG